MSSGSDLLMLPDEILEEILKKDPIRYQDMINVSKTCSRLRDVGSNLWEFKFKKWNPRLHKYMKSRSMSPNINWHAESVLRMNIMDRITQLVTKLNSRLFDPNHHAKIHLTPKIKLEISQICGLSEFGYVYCTELTRKISVQSIDPENVFNLTDGYYALHVLHMVMDILNMKDVREFMNEPPHCCDIEKATILCARWFQPQCFIQDNDITDKLDEIAEECHSRLLSSDESHPANKRPISKEGPFSDQLNWSISNVEKILHIVADVLFNTHGFFCELLHNECDGHIFMNVILEGKKTHPLMMCILFKLICQRVGVFLEVCAIRDLIFKLHFQLPGTSKIFCLNTEEKRVETRDFVRDQVPIYDKKEIFHRVAAELDVAEGSYINYLVDNLIYMMIDLNDSDVAQYKYVLLDLISICLKRGDFERIGKERETAMIIEGSDNIDPIYEKAEKFAASEDEILDKKKKVVEHRRESNDEVKYCIGLIMKHKLYNYYCVIIGWDKMCTMSESWIRQMGVHRLQRGPLQPFYSVLVDDGSLRYSAEENLEFERTPQIPHEEVGRYFTAYCSTYYEPNPEFKASFLQDEDVRNKLLKIDKDAHLHMSL